MFGWPAEKLMWTALKKGAYFRRSKTWRPSLPLQFFFYVALSRLLFLPPYYRHGLKFPLDPSRILAQNFAAELLITGQAVPRVMMNHLTGHCKRDIWICWKYAVDWRSFRFCLTEEVDNTLRVQQKNVGSSKLDVDALITLSYT